MKEGVKVSKWRAWCLARQINTATDATTIGPEEAGGILKNTMGRIGGRTMRNSE